MAEGSSLANTIVWKKTKEGKGEQNLSDSNAKGPQTDVEKVNRSQFAQFSDASLVCREGNAHLESKAPWKGHRRVGRERSRACLGSDRCQGNPRNLLRHARRLRKLPLGSLGCCCPRNPWWWYFLSLWIPFSFWSGKISVRFRAYGKWVRPYCGVDPNNETIQFPGSLIWLVKDGKITDSWIYQSYAGLFSFPLINPDSPRCSWTWVCCSQTLQRKPSFLLNRWFFFAIN